MRYLITGSSRGIGLELVRQLLDRGDTVEAIARDPGAAGLKDLASKHGDRLRLHACDVTRDAEVKAMVASLAPGGVDVVVNNAGVMGEMGTVESIDLDEVGRTYQVNAVAPLRVTRALLPRLRQGQGHKVVHISSRMGSIGDNTSGGAYGYRMAKAALNMASKNLAVELAAEGIVSTVFNPGWVKTDMGGSGAPTPVEVSVKGILEQIDKLGPADSGEFVDYRGPRVPW